jgi:hypothetical protein
VTLFVDHAGSLRRQRASQAAGFAAVTIAVAAFIGWWAGLPMPSSWGAGFPAIKPVTAVCLAALGLAPPALAGEGNESGAHHSPQFNTEMRGR